jgi:hypothetical protein
LPELFSLDFTVSWGIIEPVFTSSQKKRGPMRRSELRRLFRQHRGESARLARELYLNQATICHWFRGRVVSARIEAAVFSRAQELLKKAAQKKAAEERIRRELANAAQGSTA